MDLGLVSLRDLLVDEVGMGAEPFGAAGGGHLLDRNFPGRRGERFKTLGAFGIAMGNRGAQQPVAAVVPAGIWALCMVSAMEIGKAIACRSCAGVGNLSRRHYTVAVAQLSCLSSTGISARQFWRRIAHGQRPLRRRHLAVLSSPRS